MSLEKLFEEFKKHSDNFQHFINHHKEQARAYHAVLQNSEMWPVSRIYLEKHMQTYGQIINSIDLHIEQYLQPQSKERIHTNHQALKDMTKVLKGITLHDAVSELDTSAFIKKVDELIDQCEAFFKKMQNIIVNMAIIKAEEELKKKVTASSSATSSTTPSSTLPSWEHNNFPINLVRKILEELEHDLQLHLQKHAPQNIEYKLPVFKL